MMNKIAKLTESCTGFFSWSKSQICPKIDFAIADWPTSNHCERHSFDARGMEIAHNVVKI